MSIRALNWARRMDSGGSVCHLPHGDVYFDRTIGQHKVYVFTMVWTPYLKVGVSTNVMSRRAAVSGPMDLDIRHVRQCRTQEHAYEIERLAHELLSASHHRREWFCTTVDAAVMAIGAAAQIVEAPE